VNWEDMARRLVVERKVGRRESGRVVRWRVVRSISYDRLIVECGVVDGG
jgi:hypothetical protein